MPDLPIPALPLGPADLLLALATVLAAAFCGLLAWRLSRQEKAGAAAIAGLKVEIAGLQERLAASAELQEAEREGTRRFVEETVRDAATITATEVITHARDEIGSRTTALSEELRDAMSEALARHGAELRGEFAPTIEETLAEQLPPAFEAAFAGAFSDAFAEAFETRFPTAFAEAFSPAFTPAFAPAFEEALDRERLADELAGMLSGALAETFAEAFSGRMAETVSAAEEAARIRIEAEIPGLRAALTETLAPVIEARIAASAGEFLDERLQGEIGARLAPAVDTAMDRAEKLLAADLHDMAEAELARALARTPLPAAPEHPRADPGPEPAPGRPTPEPAPRAFTTPPAGPPPQRGGLISVHSGRR
ncbi:hypothetical protein [Oceanicella sp. SM1341]|uniref:hypothetical protein n=1 Tax=Oceanicella sp. SM1341 TaxID=1548889 RepID=UPI000E533488|nr:hypothetical protein [Oceanicella sp. SM1341]